MRISLDTISSYIWNFSAFAGGGGRRGWARGLKPKTEENPGKADDADELRGDPRRRRYFYEKFSSHVCGEEFFNERRGKKFASNWKFRLH